MDTSFETIKEKYINDYPKIISSERMEIILSQMKKNICKIYMDNGSKGTGFFCKIPYPDEDHMIKLLITNNHLINETRLKNDNQIIFTINNDKIKYKLTIGKRKVYTSKLYDTTIIEIYEDKDDINDFLELDFDLNEDYYNDIYLKESIYIIQYPNIEKLSVSYGIINNIQNNFGINHFCCTEKGSSGSPILNLSNNKLIGIHKGAHEIHNFNKGIFLIYPLKEFVSQIKNNFNIKTIKINSYKNNNLIKEKIEVKTNESDKNNLILNTNINNEDDMEYKNLYFDLNKKAISFIFFQNDIKKDFINYLKSNLDNNFKEISSTGNNLYNKNILDNNEIDQIILNEAIKSNFKIIIRDSLSKYAKFQNSIKLDNISVLVTGRSCVGVSTLINYLFKETVSEEMSSHHQITLKTLKEQTYKTTIFPFLHLTDTKGYEIKDEYSRGNYINDIINIIQSTKKPKNFLENFFDFILGNGKKEKNNYKDSYHCIWFCVNGAELDDFGIHALRKLKNDIKNIPIIVVFTYAKRFKEVESMKNQIKNLFPDLKFIPVLARKTEIKNSFGLDGLLNLTIETIKSMEKNDIFEAVMNEYKIKEENLLKNIISETSINIINKLTKEFFVNWNSFINEKDFEYYIYNLIEKLIMSFSHKKELSQKTKILLQNYRIKNFIKSYNYLFHNLINNYLENNLKEKSLEYFETKIKIEKEKHTFEYNNIKEGFIKLTYQFSKNYFYFVAQKYFIYYLIVTLLKKVCESLGKKILDKMEKFLTSEEIMEDYRKIYLKVFDNFEEYINKFRDYNSKIYN